MEFNRKPGESEEEYIYRICSQKDIIGSWYDVADIINAELNYEYTECKYRKQFQAFQKMMEGNRNVFGSHDDAVEELKKQRDELQKAKMQFFDQRREYNKLLTADARFEHLVDRLKESADNLNHERPLSDRFVDNIKVQNNGKEAVLCISDIHYGMVTDNIWNAYNTEIARNRLAKLTQKTIEYLDFHKPEILHIVLLGDMAHGAIHVGARVKSEEDTCDQLMQITELLAQMIDTLANHVASVNVYSTYGNHMRTVQDKRDSVHSDNMEKIIPWWLEQRLKDRTNIRIVPATFYEFILFNVCGYNVVATHGDLDFFKSMGVNLHTLFSKAYGFDVNYTLSGDKHHLQEFEQYGIESILIRSFCGTDDYANGKRLYSDCGQTLMFFTPEDGRECTYNIKL